MLSLQETEPDFPADGDDLYGSRRRGNLVNFYFLLAGIFLIFFSAVHAVFGELTVFRPIFQTNIDSLLKISVYIPWHQLTFVLLLSGIVQLAAAFRPRLKALPPFILAILLGNIVIFVAIAVFQRNWYVLQNSIPQYVLFAIILVFTVLGIRRHAVQPKAES